MPGDINNTTIMMALNELIDAINQLAAKLVPEGPAPDGSYDPPLDKTILGGLSGAAGGALGGGLGRVDQPFPDEYLAYRCKTAKRAVGAIMSIPYYVVLHWPIGVLAVEFELTMIFAAVPAVLLPMMNPSLLGQIHAGLNLLLALGETFFVNFYNKLNDLSEVMICKIYSAENAVEAVNSTRAYIDSRNDFNDQEKWLAKALYNIDFLASVFDNPQRFDPTASRTEWDWWPQVDCSDCPDPNDPWACDGTLTTIPFQQVDISTLGTPPPTLGSPLGVGQHTLTSQLYGFSNKLVLWKESAQPSCIKLISCTTVNLTLSLSNSNYPTWAGWEEVPIATLFAGAKCNLLELSAPDTEPVFEAVIEIY